MKYHLVVFRSWKPVQFLLPRQFKALCMTWLLLIRCVSSVKFGDFIAEETL